VLAGLLLLLFSLLAGPAAQAQERGPIYLAQVDGVVTSVKVDYLQRALRTAEASDAMVLIIQVSSEGAVLRALRPLAVEVAEATVPVVVYVAPPGTESGATGAFLLSAAHIAAMAPDTSFGSTLPLADVDETLSEQTQELVLESVVDQIRGWNEARGRNTCRGAPWN
jgi:membrane-bound serine protease (ClpP class)